MEVRICVAVDAVYLPEHYVRMEMRSEKEEEEDGTHKISPPFILTSFFISISVVPSRYPSI